MSHSFPSRALVCWFSDGTEKDAKEEKEIVASVNRKPESVEYKLSL